MNRLVALACIMCIFLYGCGMPSGADEFAESFLQKFKNTDYQSMYAMLDDDVRTKTSFDQFEAWHKKVINKLGEIKNYKKVNWQFVTFPQGVQITLSYEVEFSKSKGICNIVVIKRGNKFSIMTTNINSSGLVD